MAWEHVMTSMLQYLLDQGLLPLVAFFGQFAFVFLLGLQTANIRDRSYKHAFVTSFTISSVEILVLLSIVKSVILDQGGTTTYLCFALGGACGIVTSMWCADLTRNRIPLIRRLFPSKKQET